jgi:transposase InsO family protein
LRDLAIDRPNQVWAADITYIPIGRGFLYLVAIIDWFSRAVLAWRLSNTMDAAFWRQVTPPQPIKGHEIHYLSTESRYQSKGATSFDLTMRAGTLSICLRGTSITN